MFLLTQFVGLYVIASEAVPSYLTATDTQSAGYYFYQIISSFIIAILIVVLITKYKLRLVMKTWFLIVVIIALSISLAAIFKNIFGITNYLFPLIFAIIFGILKILRPSVVIHNVTEVLIYPGIATIFVPILTPLTAILLLIIISIYDMWAVWHSGIMQKMAKFQMNELKIFGGFLIPYLTKEVRQKIAALKKSKNKKGKKMKISMAILGGGDVVFPIITAGVFMLSLGLSYAIAVILGALLGLTCLMFFSEKKKFYPAMPFITAGIFLGLLVCYLINLI
ncbi:MAG: presenilin family intramembrane aspartyl protease [archaeon]